MRPGRLVEAVAPARPEVGQVEPAVGVQEVSTAGR
jgi:hypothetical protein